MKPSWGKGLSLWGFAALWLGGVVAMAFALTRLLGGQSALSGLQAWMLLALGLDGLLIGATGWWAAWTLSATDRRVRDVTFVAARLGGYLVAGMPLNLFLLYYWLPRVAHLRSPLPFNEWVAGTFTVLAVYVDVQMVRSAYRLWQAVRQVME